MIVTRLRSCAHCTVHLQYVDPVVSSASGALHKIISGANNGRRHCTGEESGMVIVSSEDQACASMCMHHPICFPADEGQ
jgi:hypothetical protein